MFHNNHNHSSGSGSGFGSGFTSFASSNIVRGILLVAFLALLSLLVMNVGLQHSSDSPTFSRLTSTSMAMGNNHIVLNFNKLDGTTTSSVVAAVEGKQQHINVIFNSQQQQQQQQQQQLSSSNTPQKTERAAPASTTSETKNSNQDWSLLEMAAAELATCVEWLEGELPYEGGIRGTGDESRLKAHHWDARTNKWNEEKRWTPIPQLNSGIPCTIWYVGGNTDGADGVRLQRENKCQMAVFEPVPQYAQHLAKAYQQGGVPRATVYGFGLGANTRIMRNIKLAGQSTFTMVGSGNNNNPSSQQQQDNTADLQIISVPVAYDVLVRFTGPAPDMIDLLHSNCEGCEWELMESLITTGLIHHVRHIQISMHYYPGIQDFRNRYCKIMNALKKTHVANYQQPFGWERWDQKL